MAKTGLLDSLYDALNICSRANQGSWNISGSGSNCSMIVFSDGKDEGSMITIEDLKQRVRELNMPIFIVGVLGADSSNIANLVYLARISVGEYYGISQIKLLADRLYGDRQ